MIRQLIKSPADIILEIIKLNQLTCYSEIKKELESPVYGIFLSKPAIYYHINKLIKQDKIKIQEIKRIKELKNNIPVSYFCIQTGNIAKK